MRNDVQAAGTAADLDGAAGGVAADGAGGGAGDSGVGRAARGVASKLVFDAQALGAIGGPTRLSTPGWERSSHCQVLNNGFEYAQEDRPDAAGL